MKNLIASLFLIGTITVGAAEFDLQDIEPFIQAKGDKVSHNGDIFVAVKIPKDIFEKINNGRDLAGRAKIDYDKVHSEPYYNRDYVSDWVKLTKNDLISKIGKEPTREQVFIGWVIGLKKFSKIGYDVSKIEDKETLLLLKVFQAHEINKKMGEIRIEPPPPLPTDGRPIPRRYSADWPKNEEARSRFK